MNSLKFSLKRITVIVILLISQTSWAQIILNKSPSYNCFTCQHFFDINKIEAKKDVPSIDLGTDNDRVLFKINGLHHSNIGTAATAISNNKKHLYTISYTGKIVEYDLQTQKPTGYSEGRWIKANRWRTNKSIGNSVFTSLKVLEDGKYLLISHYDILGKNDFSNYFILDISVRRTISNGTPTMAVIMLSIPEYLAKGKQLSEEEAIKSANNKRRILAQTQMTEFLQKKGINQKIKIRCIEGGCYFTDEKSIPIAHVDCGNKSLYEQLNKYVNDYFKNHYKRSPSKQKYAGVLKKSLGKKNLIADVVSLNSTTYAIFNAGLGSNCDAVFYDLSKIDSVDKKIKYFHEVLDSKFHSEVLKGKSKFSFNDGTYLVRIPKTNSYHLASANFTQTESTVDKRLSGYYHKMYPTYPWSFYSTQIGNPMLYENNSKRVIYKNKFDHFTLLAVGDQGLIYQEVYKNHSAINNSSGISNSGSPRSIDFNLPFQESSSTVLSSTSATIIGTEWCPICQGTGKGNTPGVGANNCLHCGGSGHFNITSGGSETIRKIRFSDWKIDSVLTDGKNIYFKFVSEKLVEEILNKGNSSSIIKSQRTKKVYYLIYNTNLEFINQLEKINLALNDLDFSDLSNAAHTKSAKNQNNIDNSDRTKNNRKNKTSSNNSKPELTILGLNYGATEITIDRLKFSSVLKVRVGDENSSQIKLLSFTMLVKTENGEQEFTSNNKLFTPSMRLITRKLKAGDEIIFKDAQVQLSNGKIVEALQLRLKIIL